MKNLLIDTNVLLLIIRDKSRSKVLNFIRNENQTIFISIVSVAEIESIAHQNKWGTNKMKLLQSFLNKIAIFEFTDVLKSSYVNIDSFSQMRYSKTAKYEFKTPRNMGKNDLWIAATASLLNLTLVTTDNDFNHLNETFITLRKISKTEIDKLSIN